MLSDPTQVFKVPVRLVSGPTQVGLSQAYPHGGTALGYVQNAFLEVDEEDGASVFSEARGKVAGAVRGITNYTFRILLVQYDTDALQQIYAFAGTTLREPDVGRSQQPGLKASAQPLLVAPIDAQTHPGLLIFNPVFGHPRGKKIPHWITDERSEQIEVIATEDASLHAIAVDFLRNLSLT